MKENLSHSEKENIVKKLNDRIKELRCPMCGNKEFIIADGYFMHIIQSNLSQLQLGGNSIPTVGIICKNCGFLSFHALGILELMPSIQTSPNDNKYE